MRTIYGGALVGLVLTCVGTGQAVTKGFTDLYTPPSGPVFLDYVGETYNFTHYLPTDATVTDVELSLQFHDDKDTVAGRPDRLDRVPEKVRVSFNGAKQGQQEIDTGTVHFSVETLLIHHGMLMVTLEDVKGDVYFEQSTLSGEATWNEEATPATPVTPTPEPTSLLLLGSGLVGLAVTGRKKLGLTRKAGR